MEHSYPINVFAHVIISDADHPDRFLLEEAMVKKKASDFNVILILILFT